MIYGHEASGGRFGRRRFMFGSASALAGVGLAGGLSWPRESAAQGPLLPAPKPIPGGADLSGFGFVAPYDFIHVFVPGPEGVVLPHTGVPLEGLHTEPSTITDFSGATALAFVIGEADGSDGNLYNLETDIRVMQGRYVASDGTTNEGVFALV